MSWPSTIEYYRIINQRINEALGGNHSAQIILYSVDFAAVEKDAKSRPLGRTGFNAGFAGQTVFAGSRRFGHCDQHHAQSCRTDRTSQRQKVLHIGDVTARAVKREQLTKVGLLGTRFTMQENFTTRTVSAITKLRLPSPN